MTDVDQGEIAHWLAQVMSTQSPLGYSLLEALLFESLPWEEYFVVAKVFSIFFIISAFCAILIVFGRYVLWFPAAVDIPVFNLAPYISDFKEQTRFEFPFMLAVCLVIRIKESRRNEHENWLFEEVAIALLTTLALNFRIVGILLFPPNCS